MNKRKKSILSNMAFVGIVAGGIATAVLMNPEMVDNVVQELKQSDSCDPSTKPNCADVLAKSKQHNPKIADAEDAVMVITADNMVSSEILTIPSATRLADMSATAPVAPKTDVEIVENQVKLVSEDPISTFSSDADDGSYKLFKANLNEGLLIDEDMVRVEEFINAFPYNYPSPRTTDIPFTTRLNIMPSPWSDNYLLKVGVKGYEYTIDTLPPVNLTFLVDVSGSMRGNMNIIRSGLNMLVEQLRPTDRVSIVTYAGNTSIALKNTSVFDKADINNAINALGSGGSTNGEAGILLAYQENESNFIDGGVNRVILMSDGDFNVGLDSATSLEELIKEKRKTGVTFSTVGIGGSNYQDNMMETMANKGNGVYTFLGDINDARDVFADRFIQTIKTIAKDVKYQIEFNPDNVKEYRLIGYENRVLNNEDFKNDKVDAGDLPSGETTTAIYEITLAEQEGLHPTSRYDKGNSKGEGNRNSFGVELAQLKIRFKQPDSEYGETLSFLVSKTLLEDEVDTDSAFAAQVAGFAQLYRNSDYLAESYTYQTILDALDALDLSKEQQPFYFIVKTTKALRESK